ncbi:MAG: hypothetical protein E5Y88_01770 [Mesorhizobium sp.]|uniref:Uncharacterized protein n=1 Tax=Mesorhizobium mediterraneum TaxID=43617 RepID=A0AB36R6A5_9HYPH|nr:MULTISPECIES: hypothetical protein [Mesorhizobium]RUU39407.1 hypothetical protein EOD08_14965 [Mesorhizobium sp. M6A.T.Ca.TU.002.02.2.1]AZO63659.1 hypothetical protein EJ075_00935 [Mesorhizobium sp. M6A.T.Cr.TU.016.01.1.1]PAQ00287.1 hypothetical protein CIT25_20970 [Mesorhizobium mediterraneum]RUU31543.1 hypothetical protein EOC94_05295 [Mesorhizobium sp. M6A.T.Ce.TU.016.01.1.1]RWN40321.1 MAG: hypothetical protein EOR96_15295 [Mesorhizobium sp.]
MTLITLRSTEDGIARLLAQPGDIKPRRDDIRRSTLEEASAEHQEVFGDYVADLTTACGIAEKWWEDTVNAQVKKGMDRDDAIAVSFNRRWAGPAAHPKVVWIVRLYWLACDKINTDFVPGKPVYPETFLLKWLVDAGEKELVQLIACMPYWPVGLDENGDWS